MNISDYWDMKDRLRTRLADNMIRKGTILSDVSRSNEYTGVREVGLEWRGIIWRIAYVDGMACEIKKMNETTGGRQNGIF